mmetsp:Transcript_11845/g.28350  ORF Transcript_11845/g.28350 Transcript_11845/m.28350 type:complete len:128 (-) Transcript_11845:2462-2845(-)
MAKGRVPDEPPRGVDESTYSAAQFLDRYGEQARCDNGPGCHELLTYLIENDYPPLFSLAFAQVKELLAYLRAIRDSIYTGQDTGVAIEESTTVRECEQIKKLIHVVRNQTCPLACCNDCSYCALLCT